MISESRQAPNPSDSPDAIERSFFVDDAPPRFKAVTRSNVDATPEWEGLDEELREGIRVVSAVLPFRTNRYVMEELIDWNAVPDDPIFRLTFPHRDMLSDEQFDRIQALLDGGAPADNPGRLMGMLMKDHKDELDGKMAKDLCADMCT